MKLGEVCDFVRGVTFDAGVTIQWPEEDYLPIVRAGNINNILNTTEDIIWIPKQYVNKDQLLRVGDIIICMSSGSSDVVGKTVTLENEWQGSVGAFCGIIRAKNNVLPSFASQWFRSHLFFEWRDSQARGANIQNLRFSQLSKLEIPLPPLPEQKRIAAILKDQMAAVDKARKAAEERLEAVKALPAAFLRKVFPKTGQPLPEGWKLVKLGEVLEISDSGIWGDVDPSGISVLRSTNFRNDGTLNLLDLTLRAIPRDKLDLKLLKPGDILLERSGGGPQQPVGRVCLFMGDKQDHTFGNFCQRLRTKSSICDTYYLFLNLFFFHLTGQTQLYQKQTIGIRNLEYKRYLSHEIPLPPLPEQKRIAAILKDQMAAVDKARKAAEEELATINSLPAAILRKAFNGEI